MINISAIIFGWHLIWGGLIVVWLMPNLDVMLISFLLIGSLVAFFEWSCCIGLCYSPLDNIIWNFSCVSPDMSFFSVFIPQLSLLLRHVVVKFWCKIQGESFLLSFSASLNSWYIILLLPLAGIDEVHGGINQIILLWLLKAEKLIGIMSIRAICKGMVCFPSCNSCLSVFKFWHIMADCYLVLAHGCTDSFMSRFVIVVLNS